jgi:hypothetical protein
VQTLIQSAVRWPPAYITQSCRQASYDLTSGRDTLRRGDAFRFQGGDGPSNQLDGRSGVSGGEQDEEGGWFGINRFLGLYVVNSTQYGEGGVVMSK